ncbi:MAG: DMT family transporter [Endomicrobiales bacterium]|nr:DMT family transporter [Endomicrobiales bacterium]
MTKELKGEISILVSCLIFGIIAVLVKMAAAAYSGAFIASIRYIVGVLSVVLFLKILRKPMIIHDIKYWLLRGIFGFAATTLFYVAIKITSSGRATLLVNTYPAFVVVYGYLFFKEKIYVQDIIRLVMCLIGAVFVFYDGSDYNIKGDLLALLAGACAGFAVHYIKKSREKNNSFTVYLATCSFGLLLIPFTYKQAYSVHFNAALLLIVIALLGFVAQIAISYGYKYVSATKGSILSYATIPMALMLSYFINEEFKLRFFIGILFIASGLLIAHNKVETNEEN